MRIESNIAEFKNHFEKGSHFSFNRQREWKKGNLFTRIKYLFYSHSKVVAKQLILSLKQIELCSITNQEVQDLFDIAHKLYPKLKKDETLKQELKKNLYPIFYRAAMKPLSLKHGGEKKQHDVLEKLRSKVVEWKTKHPQLSTSALTEHDEAALKTLSEQYNPLACQILKSKSIWRDFSKWTIENVGNIDAFALFPDRMNHIFKPLSTRICFHGGLHVTKTPNGFTFELDSSAGRINLLDEKREYILQDFGGYFKVTVPEIFKELKKKRCEQRLSFSEKGLINWARREHAAWDERKKEFVRRKITPELLLNDIPSLGKIYTEDTLKERFSKNNVIANPKPGEWVAVGMADSRNLEPDIQNGHGWLELYEPLPDNKFKLVLAKAKWPRIFPVGVIQSLNYMLATVPGQIEIQDDGLYNTSRYKAGFGVNLTDDEAKKLLQRICEGIQKGLDGKLIFQPAGQNCMDDVWNDFEAIAKEKLDRLFPMKNPAACKLTEMRPSSKIVKGLIDISEKCPEKIQKHVLKFFSWSLGYHRALKVGDKSISLKKHELYGKELSLVLPSKMRKSLEPIVKQHKITKGSL